jgi:4-aminobutyrate aminotransferase-like enzyme
MFDQAVMGRVVHATTLGGNAVAMAVAARLFEVLERDNLVERAARLGEQIKTRLGKFAKKHKQITDIRGKGLFLGIEVDPAQGWFEKAADVANRCLDRGVMINAAKPTVLRLAPPMIVSEDELDKAWPCWRKPSPDDAKDTPIATGPVACPVCGGWRWWVCRDASRSSR